MAAAVARAIELGVSGLVTPTAGNAGAALAAYAARAGVPAYMVAPEDARESCISQARLYGAEVELIPGLISDAGRIAEEVARCGKIFPVVSHISQQPLYKCAMLQVYE